MSRVLDELVKSGSISEERAVEIRAEAAKMAAAVKSDPALRCEANEKLAAGPLNLGQALKYTAAATGLGMAAQAGSQLVRKGVDVIHSALTKSKHYKAMVDANPELKDLPAEKVQMAFDTLHKFNPDFASDPMVAGEYVYHAAEQGGYPMKEISGIVSARKALLDIRDRGTGMLPKIPFDIGAE